MLVGRYSNAIWNQGLTEMIYGTELGAKGQGRKPSLSEKSPSSSSQGTKDTLPIKGSRELIYGTDSGAKKPTGLAQGSGVTQGSGSTQGSDTSSTSNTQPKAAQRRDGTDSADRTEETGELPQGEKEDYVVVNIGRKKFISTKRTNKKPARQDKSLFKVLKVNESYLSLQKKINEGTADLDEISGIPLNLCDGLVWPKSAWDSGKSGLCNTLTTLLRTPSFSNSSVLLGTMNPNGSKTLRLVTGPNMRSEQLTLPLEKLTLLFDSICQKSLAKPWLVPLTEDYQLDTEEDEETG